MPKIINRSVACILLSATLVATPAHAGLMWFSRANCLNNESISWDWLGRKHWLLTDSHHAHAGLPEHLVSAAWENTNRSAAIHWGEGVLGGYRVAGDHWHWMPGYGLLYLGRTDAVDCDLVAMGVYW